MNRFSSLICLVDPSQSIDAAVERAVAVAVSNQASLKVVAVAPDRNAEIKNLPRAISAEKLTVSLMEARSKALEQKLEPYAKKTRIDIKVLRGIAFLETIREVIRYKHDLLVKSVSSPEWLDQFFGSDDTHLLRKCPCPVWLLKPSKRKFQRVVAAVDIDDAYPADELAPRDQLNRDILTMAASVAANESADLHVISVWQAIGESVMRGVLTGVPEPEIIRYVEQARIRFKENLDELIKKVASDEKGIMKHVVPRLHLVKGSAAEQIPRLVTQVNGDLLVMGTVARTGIPGLIVGNTAENILNQIQCSVLAVKPRGFETPVTLE